MKLTKQQFMEQLRLLVQAELKALYEAHNEDGESLHDHIPFVETASLAEIVELLEEEYSWDAEGITRLLLGAAVEEVDDFTIQGRIT